MGISLKPKAETVRPGDGAREDRDDGRSSPSTQELLLEIEAMLEGGSYGWAEDTLTGIFDTVSRSGRVSPGQARAIENIRAGGDRKGRRGAWNR